MLELLLSQSTPHGTAFGLDKFDRASWEDQAGSVEWLSSSISAVRSIISVMLMLPHGEETAMSNIGWITLYCGLSLAVRLDIVLSHARFAAPVQHLRQFLDITHTLRQVILRLEATASSDAEHPFHSLAKRVRRVEERHKTLLNEMSSHPNQIPQHTMQSVGTPGSDMSMGGVSLGGQGPGWNQEMGANSMLFSDPFEFLQNLTPY